MSDEKDEVIIEPDDDRDDSVIAEEHQEETIKKLKEKLKAAEEKAKEYLDSWQRAQADFLNLRRRDEEAKVKFVRFAKSDILTELLPVLDSFDLAIRHPSGKTELATGQAEKNIEAISKQLMRILENHGLEVSDPLGEKFDPRLHESIRSEEVENQNEDHRILEIVQKGYILGGKIIRPAKVIIGEYHV